MDVLFPLAFAFGLVYVMVRAARWAFKLDAKARETSPRKVRRRRERFLHPDLEDIDALTKRAFGFFDRKPPK